MPKVKISEFSATPASNTDIDGINIAEGCAPSGINDAIRELMSQLKDFQTGAAGDSFNGPVGTSTAAAGAFTTLTTSGAVTHNGGTANGVAYLNGSKVLTSGNALTFDGTRLTVQPSTPVATPTWNAVDTAVFSQTSNSLIRLHVGASGGTVGVGFDVGSTRGVGGIFYDTGGNSTQFFVANAEQMRLTSTGLGIGTSSPSFKLDVQQSTSQIVSRLLNTNTSGVSLASQIVAANNGTVNYQLDVDGTGANFGQGALLGTTTNHPLWIRTNNTIRATLDTSGNLGLGVTPSAYLSTVKAIDISSAGSIIGGGANVSLAANAFLNSSGNWIYKNSSVFAGKYTPNFANNGSHVWEVAPSGTAGNAISFTQAMTLDASARLSLGTTTASSGFSSINLSGGPTGANTGIQLHYKVGSGGGGAITTVNATGGGLSFYTFTGDVGSESYSERARIDSSGNLLVGTTSGSGRVRAASSVADIFSANTTNGQTGYFYGAGQATGTAAYFTTTSGQAGLISVSGNTTTYTSGSDYRLKENIRPLTGALAKVAAMKPVAFDWKADNTYGESFIAHELAEVCPQAVIGEKDAVDAEGKPVYQGIDTSFLVATLTAAIQEQQALIQTLTARVAALESN